MNHLPFFLLGTAFVVAGHLPLQGSQLFGGCRPPKEVELAVAGFNAEGLYGLLWDALSHPSLPMAHPCQETSMGCHCDHIQATPRIVKMLVQTPASVDEGGTQAQETPPLAILQALEVTIPTKMTPLYVNMGATKRVYHYQVEGHHKVPSTSHVAICAHVFRDHLGVKLSCPSCQWTFLNLNAVRQHKKQGHTLGSPDPH